MEGFNRKHEVVEQVLPELSNVEVIATDNVVLTGATSVITVATPSPGPVDCSPFICVLSIGRELAIVGRIVLQLH
jgi:hypothetical protein